MLSISQHLAFMRVLRRVTRREEALERLNAQGLWSADVDAAALGHRAVGFFGTLPAYRVGRHYFKASSLGVAGPKGKLP